VVAALEYAWNDTPNPDTPDVVGMIKVKVCALSASEFDEVV
jgi:hypothetical protein